jgi:putative ABC transport system substrate-binding protein
VQLQFAEMRNTRDLDDALRTMADVGADALYVVSSRQTVLVMPRIVDFAMKNHLPLAAGWGAWARAGGLLSYGPDIDEMLRRVSSYLDKVMKGAKPKTVRSQKL